MNLAICVICYNRKTELIKLINCLLKIKTDEKIDLIISIDFSADQFVINEVATSINWPFGEHKIILHNNNLGLKKHVLSCGDLSDGYDGLVLLEDDLIISPYLIEFVTSSLEKSYLDGAIAGVSLYSYTKKESNKMPFTPFIDSYDSYFIQYPSSWGFVVTPKQWRTFKEWLTLWDCEYFEDDLVPHYICQWGAQSWKKHLVRYLVHNDKYFIHPRFSLSTNPGADGTHHNGINSLYSVPICMGARTWKVSNFSESQVIYDVNFEPTKKLHESFSETFDDGHISMGSTKSGSKANHVFNNYFFTVADYIEFSFIFFLKNTKKVLFKLGIKK